MRTFAIVLVAAAVVAGACTSNAEHTTTTLAPATTAAATTAPPTTSEATTTTVDDRAVVTANVSGADEPLAAVIAAVYELALNPGQDTFIEIPEGLTAQFAERTPTVDDHMLSGDVAFGRIVDTDIAVFFSGWTDEDGASTEGDLVLLVGEAGADTRTSGEWQVVGAKLASLGEPAWYGDAPGMVLLLGSDARPGQKVAGFRADSVHILSAVPATGQGSIVGIPRDSWVAASYGGNAKLTNTMASRGPGVVLDTVKASTGLELQGYLLTGFQGFDELVDAFGGFTMDVPYGMADPKSNAYFTAGVQELDGAEALAFSRNRTDTPNGDFGRQFNHGRVTLAILTEVQDRPVEMLPMLLEMLTDFVITDLDAAQLLTLGASVYEMDVEAVTNIVARGSVGSTSGGASVVFLSDAAHELFADVADGVVDGDY